MESNFDINFMLTDKVAIITGGASGIGRTTAEMFAAKGAKVAIVDVNPQVEEVAAQISPDVFAVKADITNTAEIDNVIQAVSNRFGKIDILCNIAGLGHSDNAENITEKDWQKVVSVNMTALFFMAQRVGRYMINQKTGGKIINMASQAGIVGLDLHACYGATKAAVINITKTLANEWGKYKINVNAISPTVVLTPMSREAWKGEKGEEFMKKIPIGRFGTMEEIAACCVYLASDASNLITGENIVMDGGFTII